MLVNHDQRLQMIEANWPQMARTVNTLADEADRTTQLEQQVTDLRGLVLTLTCGVVAIALLSAFSFSYLSNRTTLGGADVPVSSQ